MLLRSYFARKTWEYAFHEEPAQIMDTWASRFARAFLASRGIGRIGPMGLAAIGRSSRIRDMPHKCGEVGSFD